MLLYTLSTNQISHLIMYQLFFFKKEGNSKDKNNYLIL